jgi:prevent-host-death family protein
MSAAAEKTVGVTEFKPRSLELIEEVASGKVGRLVLTKRGRPVVAVVPVSGGRVPSLRGALKHLMEPVPGVDLTEPTGEVWEAERD